MTGDELGRIFARAEDSFERARASSARTDRTLARADDIIARTASGDTVRRAAARRERQRLNAGLGRTVTRAVLVLAAVWLATIILGLINPIGMFGLISAILVGLVLTAVVVASSRAPARPALPAADLPTGRIVDGLDSYLYRARPALPAPAQAEIDQLLNALPELKPALERAGAGDPAVQDARRLMGTHLPNLVERYLNVPPTYRGSASDEISVDERLIDALRAGREALGEVGETLARGDVAAFETQGRFIESRYKDESLER